MSQGYEVATVKGVNLYEALLTMLSAVLVGILGSALLVVLVMLVSDVAGAETGEADLRETGYLVKKDDTSQGSLLFKTEQQGFYLAAPVLNTHVDMKIRGMVARVKVEQVFRNPTSSWHEGVYVFPLPDSSAVDAMRMRIGDRVIEGEIREKQAARRLYEKARAQGKKASLVEQHRPNIFSNAVANIGPGEEVRITIEYQQTVNYKQGVFSLRFPMVVAPRYIPGRPLVRQKQGGGWAFDTDTVKDASRITPPLQTPGEGKINPVTMSIRLEPGISLSDIQSRYHEIDINEYADTYKINLRSTEYADRDFELTWKPANSNIPKAAMFSERIEGEDYALLMVMPPNANKNSLVTIPRDVTYVIDTSGSMAGASIRQAKSAMRTALSGLRQGDRFNIIQFNSHSSRLFPASTPVTYETLSRARHYIDRLRASGGTEMKSALELALLDNDSSDEKHLKQLVFITDGSVGNESELFAFIEGHIGNSRLFTVGIGSAPNSHFMKRAAKFGRGTFTHIGRADEVGEKMSSLFAQIDTPVMSDIRIDWGGAGAEQWPNKISDLYLGEPVIVTAKMSSLPGKVRLTGRHAGKPWSIDVPTGLRDTQGGIHRLWARQKIAVMMDKLYTGHDANTVKQEVTRIALKHGLVSKYTSLVAVDKTPSRPQDKTLKQRSMPVNLPKGWRYESVMKSVPSTATASTELLFASMLLFIMACLLTTYLYVMTGRGRESV